MQREDILRRIAEIDAELKRRRQKSKIELYNSGRTKHKKQMAFHKCRKRNRWVFGGNRSGKTECGAENSELSAKELDCRRYYACGAQGQP